MLILRIKEGQKIGGVGYKTNLTDSDRVILKEIAVILEEARSKIKEKVASLSPGLENCLDDYRQIEDAENAQNIESVIEKGKKDILSDFVSSFKAMAEFYPE